MQFYLLGKTESLTTSTSYRQALWTWSIKMILPQIRSLHFFSEKEIFWQRDTIFHKMIRRYRGHVIIFWFTAQVWPNTLKTLKLIGKRPTLPYVTINKLYWLIGDYLKIFHHQQKANKSSPLTVQIPLDDPQFILTQIF